MTAQELINALSKLPPDVTIVVGREDCGELLLEPAYDLVDMHAVKLTTTDDDGKEVHCYEFPLDDTNPDTYEKVYLLDPDNTHSRYNDALRQARRKALLATQLTNDDFDPAL